MSERPLRIQICNERFIARFGVDRLLLLMAAHFEKMGAQVNLTCLRYDRAVVGKDAEVSAVPMAPALDMQQTERQATTWVMGQWLSTKPDIVICGGWPFFDLAARARSVGVGSIFIDAGAVPHDGIPARALPVQQELRRIRALCLPTVDRILPISDFIRLSQTEFDRGRADGVKTVHLGADHLLKAEPQTSNSEILVRLRALKAQGQKLILLLGRFEEHGYKNSPRAFDVMRKVKASHPKARLLILGKPTDVPVPQGLTRSTTLLGNPSDGELQEIMCLSNLAISTSLWEGFNLPLVEAQITGCPVLAFNVAAHPEVIADPCYLCEDVEEMATKAAELLGSQNENQNYTALAMRLAGFKSRFPWSKTLAAYWDEVKALAAAPAPAKAGKRLVLVDVTNSARDTGNSGVVRVARQLSASLIKHPCLDVVCVRWEASRNAYALISDGVHLLNGFGGPFDPTGFFVGDMDVVTAVDRLLLTRPMGCAAHPVMLFPEVALDGSAARRLDWARRNGLAAVAILYDLIPVYHAQYCAEDVVRQFKPYIATLMQMDALTSISATSLADFNRFAAEAGQRVPKRSLTHHLPAQLGKLPRAKLGIAAPMAEVRILCVSTLEPRKNHKTLLAAFEALVARRSDITFKLHLVGNRYGGRPDIPESIEAAKARGVPVEWLGVISDEALMEEYEAAHFSVYPSLFEGYGMPIVESLWMGRPCLCSNDGVMAELAREGGCQTTDVTSADALAQAMEQLATDASLHQRLAQEALARPLDDWRSYGDKIARFIYNLHNLHPVAEAPSPNLMPASPAQLRDAQELPQHGP